MLDRFVPSLKRRWNRVVDAGTGLFVTRVNLCCGSDIKPGWVNLDLHPVSAKVRRFNLTNESDLQWLSTLNADRIEMHHAISYLNIAQAVAVLNACHASLVQGGELVLEFPDLQKLAAKLATVGEDNLDEYLELVRAIYAYDVEDAYDPGFDKQTYVFGWSGPILTRFLLQAGFATVRTLRPEKHGPRPWRDTRLVATR